MHKNKYEVVTMVTEEHLPMLKKMLPYCVENIPCSKINVIGSAKIKDEIIQLNGVDFIDEDTVYPQLSFESVQNVIFSISGKRSRAGWYLQQFLKMAWAYKTSEKAYIVLDADTFILNPISFISENGRYLFTAKTEYHAPYFNTIKKLFDNSVTKEVDFSFIAENMIFDVDIMKEMIECIENNKNLVGNNFFEKILFAIDPYDLLWSGFSEFETYGNFIMHFYPDKVEARKLRTQREALVILGSHPSKVQLEWAKKDYDIISIESATYRDNLFVKLSRLNLYRKMFSMKDVVRFRMRIRTVYRKLLGKADFQFEEL